MISVKSKVIIETESKTVVMSLEDKRGRKNEDFKMKSKLELTFFFSKKMLGRERDEMNQKDHCIFYTRKFLV